MANLYDRISKVARAYFERRGWEVITPGLVFDTDNQELVIYQLIFDDKRFCKGTYTKKEFDAKVLAFAPDIIEFDRSCPIRYDVLSFLIKDEELTKCLLRHELGARKADEADES